MTWTTRLGELAGFDVLDVRWRDAWAVIARGERAKGRPWAQGLLWSLKLHAWIVSLDADPSTCRTCGGLIRADHARARYCGTPCRKVAYRAREKKQPTAWADEVARAQEALADWRREATLAQRALRRWQQAGPALIMPPDWTRYDPVVALPSHCATHCRGACPHTDGGICLYAATAVPFSDDLTEEQEPWSTDD